MIFLPTQNLPTHLLRRNFLAVALGGLGLCCALLAHAHEETTAVPDVFGVRLGVALAAADVNASQELPSQRLAGYLLQGDAGVDRRVSQLEHAVVGLGWRINPEWATYAAVGKHGADMAHTEAAWVRYERSIPEGGRVRVLAGRTRPELGPVMTQAGHLDSFTLMPLARRVAMDGDWIDEGLQISGQHSWGDDWSGDVDIGLWRGRVFPGDPSVSSMVPSVHLGLSRGDWRGDVFGASFQPEGRGALAQGNTVAHTHNAPDCGALRSGVLCFVGRSHVVGTSLQWASHVWPVTVQSAYWLRHDDGTLISTNGRSNHSGRYSGGWLQALWQPRADWQVGWRSERIQAHLSLVGVGATLLAQEAGFSGSARLRRDTALLSWQPQRFVTLSAEAGRETRSGQRVNSTVLRAVFQTNILASATP